MADYIISKCSQLKITEEEDRIIPLGEAGGDDEPSRLEFTIVGKVLT